MFEMNPAKVKDIMGQKFGRWNVIEPVGKKDGCIVYLCRCDCGNERNIKSTSLLTGHSKMCQSCSARKRKTKHGYSNTPEYTAWIHMIERCYNPNCSEYKNYGARGITVCDAWRKSFEAFISDVGDRPGTEYSLDRINNNGDYEPGNVRWTTWDVQSKNRRGIVHVTVNGRTLCLTDWSREIGCSTTTIRGNAKRRNMSLADTIVYLANERDIEIA